MTEVAGTDNKPKVFVSYSRRDSADFAEELVAGLELAGFAPFLDRHDIAAGEEWELRLGSLIRQADTVVYVISPEAIKSSRCEWEVSKALGESKRVLPIVFKSVAERDIPHELERRQFIRFDTGSGITRPLRELAEALRQDIEWIREHTRISELAIRWEARARPESLLLRGDELSAAQSWADKWKPGEPAVTDAMRGFLSASKEREAASFVRAEAARRRMLQMQALVGAFVAVIVVGVAAWWQQESLKERVYAWRNVHVLTAAQEKALKPGDPPFRECTNCPEMIVIPAGSFTMGSPAGQGTEYEHPLHDVRIAKPFAVSKFELTYDEWDACASHGHCDPNVMYAGRGGQEPAINLSWDDSQVYVKWLSRVTGKEYRLLSEAEYEYAARAGTQTTYPWGDDIEQNGKAMANCYTCLDHRRTTTVGSFAPNRFGLYDMIGNVAEWTEDCLHMSYDGAPTDGSAWTTGDCSDRIVRGGHWRAGPSLLRSASRTWVLFNNRDDYLGFRVARTLLAP
jgi:formylglycine-generating enzyme required for sulfatase activity